MTNIYRSGGQYETELWEMDLNKQTNNTDRWTEQEERAAGLQSTVLCKNNNSPTIKCMPNVDRWIEHDKEHRKKDFEELFCALDLHSVPPATFTSKIEKHPLVIQSEKCQVCVFLNLAMTNYFALANLHKCKSVSKLSWDLLLTLVLTMIEWEI